MKPRARYEEEKNEECLRRHRGTSRDVMGKKRKHRPQTDLFPGFKKVRCHPHHKYFGLDANS
jgi:hypothetical protein